MVGLPLRCVPTNWQRWKHRVTDTAASIIDFSAYRARKRARVEPPRAASHEYADGMFPMVLCWFWPIWVWVPYPAPAAFGAGQDPA